ncbi:unnamed protein product, partial [Choristocarpus tenellus]
MDRSLLAKATSNDESPTPGYLFGEIASMTHANFEACRQLENYLLTRIKKNNHNIKRKCLQIIKHVCMKGRSDFKMTMRREAEVIKACLAFTGPPDPLRGEEIYRRVREIAKETLDAIYSDAPSERSSSMGGQRYSSGNRIEGFGSGLDQGTDGGVGVGRVKGGFVGAMGSAFGSVKGRMTSGSGGG